MDEGKLNFLKNEFIPRLQQLESTAKGNWGVMNGQEMVEHLCDAVKNASGRLVVPLLNQGERLEKSRQFLESEKPFKENTKNPLIADPFPLRKPSMQAAIAKLTQELDYFFLVFENNPNLTTLNPIFGELDYTQNVQLLHKHAMHHLRQFGLV
jgi:hypothetical protein